MARSAFFRGLSFAYLALTIGACGSGGTELASAGGGPAPDPSSGAGVDGGSGGGGGGGGGGDGGTVDAGDAATDSPAKAFPGFSGPIAITADNYEARAQALAPFKPFMIYGWASDNVISQYTAQIAALTRNNGGYDKMLIFSSYKTMEQKLVQPGHAAMLKGIGVTTMGYNFEGDKTPANEFADMEGSAVKFGQVASKYGFKALWGPIRARLDSTSATAIANMRSGGVTGLALQEQQYINTSCPADRASAVKSTVAKWRAPGTMHAQMQIMPSTCVAADTNASQRCGMTKTFTYQACVDLVKKVSIDIDSLAIWASGSDAADLPNLVKAIREK